MNVTDIGHFPGINMAFLWLTVGLPAFLVIMTWIALGIIKFKDPDTAAGLGFGAFIFGGFAVFLSTVGVSGDLNADRRDNMLEAVRDQGYSSVVELDSNQGADISAVGEDGTGYLFDFIDLPNDHIGILNVTEKIK